MLLAAFGANPDGFALDVYLCSRSAQTTEQSKRPQQAQTAAAGACAVAGTLDLRNIAHQGLTIFIAAKRTYRVCMLCCRYRSILLECFFWFRQVRRK